MPNRTDLDARLDAIAAQMPRFREDLDRVFADIGGGTASSTPAPQAATDPQQRLDRHDVTVDRATRH
jgi:hypothetical protein